MMKQFVVFSAFDGISCVQLALHKAGFRDYLCYASEINAAAKKITQYRFPQTQQVGDIRNVDARAFRGKVDLLSGGSPCKDFSIMGRLEGMIVDTLEKYLMLKAEGFKFRGQSYLVWEYVRILKEIQPKYFFLENVRMKEEWAEVISQALGVPYVHINSNLVSAQNRDRYYWTNIPLSEIYDLGIRVQDIIPDAVTACGKRGRKYKKTDPKYTPYVTYRKDQKFNCLVTSPYQINQYLNQYGETMVITPEHAEMLQTIPVGYTNVPGISKTQRYEALGNAWTIDVIVKFFENMQIESLVEY